MQGTSEREFALFMTPIQESCGQQPAAETEPVDTGEPQLAKAKDNSAVSEPAASSLRDRQITAREELQTLITSYHQNPCESRDRALTSELWKTYGFSLINSCFVNLQKSTLPVTLDDYEQLILDSLERVNGEKWGERCFNLSRILSYLVRKSTLMEQVTKYQSELSSRELVYIIRHVSPEVARELVSICGDRLSEDDLVCIAEIHFEAILRGPKTSFSPVTRLRLGLLNEHYATRIYNSQPPSGQALLCSHWPVGEYFWHSLSRTLAGKLIQDFTVDGWENEDKEVAAFLLIPTGSLDLILNMLEGVNPELRGRIVAGFITLRSSLFKDNQRLLESVLDDPEQLSSALKTFNRDLPALMEEALKSEHLQKLPKGERLCFLHNHPGYWHLLKGDLFDLRAGTLLRIVNAHHDCFEWLLSQPEAARGNEAMATLFKSWIYHPDMARKARELFDLKAGPKLRYSQVREYLIKGQWQVLPRVEQARVLKVYPAVCDHLISQMGVDKLLKGLPAEDVISILRGDEQLVEKGLCSTILSDQEKIELASRYNATLGTAVNHHETYNIKKTAITPSVLEKQLKKPHLKYAATDLLKAGWLCELSGSQLFEIALAHGLFAEELKKKPDYWEKLSGEEKDQLCGRYYRLFPLGIRPVKLLEGSEPENSRPEDQPDSSALEFCREQMKERIEKTLGYVFYHDLRAKTFNQHKFREKYPGRLKGGGSCVGLALERCRWQRRIQTHPMAFEKKRIRFMQAEPRDNTDIHDFPERVHFQQENQYLYKKETRVITERGEPSLPVVDRKKLKQLLADQQYLIASSGRHGIALIRVNHGDQVHVIVDDSNTCAIRVSQPASEDLREELINNVADALLEQLLRHRSADGNIYLSSVDESMLDKRIMPMMWKKY